MYPSSLSELLRPSPGRPAGFLFPVFFLCFFRLGQGQADGLGHAVLFLPLLGKGSGRNVQITALLAIGQNVPLQLFPRFQHRRLIDGLAVDGQGVDQAKGAFLPVGQGEHPIVLVYLAILEPWKSGVLLLHLHLSGRRGDCTAAAQGAATGQKEQSGSQGGCGDAIDMTLFDQRKQPLSSDSNIGFDYTGFCIGIQWRTCTNPPITSH